MNYKKFDKWLRRNLRGYEDLTPEMMRRILYFSVAWSLFESRALGEDGVRKGIDKFLVNHVPLDVNMRSFQPAMQYFAGRYVTDNKTNDAFDDLVSRSPDLGTYIGPVLLGNGARSRGQLQALLYIVFCLRSNMIHGVKWQWGYKKQMENLDQSIGVLHALLDEYAPKDSR